MHAKQQSQLEARALQEPSRVLDMLDLSALEACCRGEVESNCLADPTNTRLSIELLSRATLQDNQQAWEAWQRCFGEVLRSWLRRHPRAEQACHLDSEEHYLARTFECFRQAVTDGQLAASTPLSTVLRYLQACLNGVLLDALRGKTRRKGIPRQEPADPEEQAGGEPPNAHRVSRRTLLIGGIAAVGLAGVAMAWWGFAQPSALTSFAPTRSSLPVALLRKGQTLSTYRGHAAAVFSVGWSPDGTSIASGGEDSLIQVWDAATGRMKPSFIGKTYPGIINSLAWSPDGTSLAVAGNRGVHVLDGTSGMRRYALLDTGIVLAVAWSPDGTALALGTDHPSVLLCDAIAGTWKRMYAGHTSIVNAVAWSPDGTSIASGSTDTTVQVWLAM